MSSMANLPLFAFFLLLGSWGSANANALSQEKVAVYPKLPVPAPALAPPVYKSPPTIPVSTPPPVKAPPTTPVPPPPYIPSPPVKPPVKAPYTPSPPMKAPSSPPPPAKAPYTPSPPAKAPASPPPAKAPYIPSPPVKPPSSPVPPVTPPSPAAPKPPPVFAKECLPLCGRRCAAHSRTKICVRACLTCCYRCKCVPPGTYGNKEVCGKCYTDMTTHGSRTKCP